MTNINFKKLYVDAKPFEYSRDLDACMDIFAYTSIVLSPGQTTIVNSGISLEIPPSYEGLVRGRSGLASKGIYVHLGTIDETYRGDVGVIMTNMSNTSYIINKGDRIAQFTIKPVVRIELKEANELSTTNRGENGYGSSGI